MLYDSSTAPHLKPWLVRTLEPICDAEPGALADYVLALLKHNVPENEMRKELTLQLEEFLEKESPIFIDTLFTVLRTKSYLPYADSAPMLPSYSSSSSTQQPSDVGIPIPLDGLLQNNATSPERGQKRALEYDDHHPAKGPRLSTDTHFNRYSNGRDYRQWGEGSERQGAANTNGQRIQTYQPPERRGICRDYHKNGYCARGALCKYSHGDDAFVPSQLFPMNTSGPIPFMPMFPNGAMPFAMPGAGAAYDPHEARLDMHPNGGMMGINGRPQRPPVVPRRWQDPSNRRASGELPVIQDLTPQDAAAGTSTQPVQNGIQENSSSQTQGGDMDVEDTAVAPSTPGSRSAFTGRGPHRERGTFPGDAQSFRPERRSDKTLVVEKIPQDKLSLDAVNGWFKRFGTVTNVAIDVQSSKALVSFSEHREAFAAWKSEDAVFNNRFVKVFWHRPLEGHGQKGARMLAASAPLVASISGRPPASANSAPSSSPAQAEPTTSSPAPAPASAPTPTPRKPPVSTVASDLAAKQKLLEQQIAEQKSLMAALATASGEEKKSLMARLRKLGEEIQPSSAPTASSHSSSPAAPQVPEHEQKERHRLDRELEIHHAASSGESTEELQAKLAKLREEAASLGISEYSYGPGASGAHRPYRGRGRGGRSFVRGGARGGLPRSMKLDNRPRQLLIKGAAEGAIPAIRSWYEATGQLETVCGEDGNVIVAFRTRAAAEQALTKGSDIPSVGPVQVTWHTSQQSNANSQAPTVSSSQSGHTDKTADEPRSSSPPRHTLLSSRPQEEEVVASGWGDGDEDGMGF